MSQSYDDIINLPHPRSKRHAPMSQSNRAAQFAPFAALTGYEAAIAEAGRLTDAFQELDEGMKELLDRKLTLLEEWQAERPEVTIRYFDPDDRKEGGSYREVSGVFWKVDPRKKMVYLEEGEGILLERITDIDISNLGGYWDGFGEGKELSFGE